MHIYDMVKIDTLDFEIVGGGGAFKNAFWKECKKHTISKSALSNCVDGVTGEADIADIGVFIMKSY